MTYPDGILWRAKPDGSESVQLTTPPLYAFWPDWAPDGSQIVFTGARDATHQAIYTVAGQGGQPVLIAPIEPERNQWAAKWSPDGNKMVYRMIRTIRSVSWILIAVR